MAPRPIPARHYGTEPLPSGAEAMGETFAAFPFWFLRITCGRCGKPMPLPTAPCECRVVRGRRRGVAGHPGGQGGRCTGIEGVSSRPVRRIVVREG